MPSTSHRALRHMAWANQKVYASVQALPEDALSAYIVNPDWTAGNILRHIVNGADWFAFCLTQDRMTRISAPTNMGEVAELAKMLAGLDARFLPQDELPDAEITIRGEGGKSWQAMRSTVLAQTVHHATEHRAQLIDALEYKGFQPIILDKIDPWAFERFERAERTEAN